MIAWLSSQPQNEPFLAHINQTNTTFVFSGRWNIREEKNAIDEKAFLLIAFQFQVWNSIPPINASPCNISILSWKKLWSSDLNPGQLGLEASMLTTALCCSPWRLMFPLTNYLKNHLWELSLKTRMLVFYSKPIRASSHQFLGSVSSFRHLLFKKMNFHFFIKKVMKDFFHV